MTNEEAVKELEAIRSAISFVYAFTIDEKREAIDLAIKALGNGIPEVEPAEFLRKAANHEDH